MHFSIKIYIKYIITITQNLTDNYKLHQENHSWRLLVTLLNSK